jgi:phage tail sheath protein FI
MQAWTWLNDQTFDGDATKYAAVYYPWLKAPDALALEGPNRAVPPSGHVAGQYAFTDNQFGVRKPPANVELDFAVDVAVDIEDPQQGFLNERGINAIRVFAGRGIRVWGARSISQDAQWKFIHVRRLLSMIEDSVERASQWTVFQPNDFNLRKMLTHSLNVFLESIWASGGLRGARPQDAFYVKCDGTNNPQSSIDQGLLICQVGVAIAAPMEFLVFDLRRSVEGQQVVEA